MIVITPRQIDAAQFRYDDLLALAAHNRLITAATQPSPSATLPRAGHFCASLRQVNAAPIRRDVLLAAAAAVASLAALASIG